MLLTSKAQSSITLVIRDPRRESASARSKNRLASASTPRVGERPCATEEPFVSRSHSKRLAAFRSQKCHCYYCGAPMWLQEPAKFASRYSISLKQAARFQCTAEHLVARQDGGSDARNNIVAACQFCNSQRHRRLAAPDPQAYRKLIARRLERRRWHPQKLHHVLGLSPP